MAQKSIQRNNLEPTENVQLIHNANVNLFFNDYCATMALDKIRRFMMVSLI